MTALVIFTVVVLVFLCSTLRDMSKELGELRMENRNLKWELSQARHPVNRRRDQ